MVVKMNVKPVEWDVRTKDIKTLMEELNVFDDKELTVVTCEIDEDGNEIFKTVKLVGKNFIDGKPVCCLFL